MKASQYAPFRIYFLFSFQLEALPHTQFALRTNTITRFSTNTTQKKKRSEGVLMQQEVPAQTYPLNRLTNTNTWWSHLWQLYCQSIYMAASAAPMKQPPQSCCSARRLLWQKLYNISILNNYFQIFHIWPTVTKWHEYQINIQTQMSPISKKTLRVQINLSTAVKGWQFPPQIYAKQYFSLKSNNKNTTKNKQQFKLYVLRDKWDKQNIIATALKTLLKDTKYLLEFQKAEEIIKIWTTIYFNWSSWKIQVI